MKKRVNIISIILMIVTIFLTIGYAAFIDTLSVSNVVVKIRPEKLTRISAATTSSGYISNFDYNMNELTGIVNIPNGASITFNTTITTYNNVPSALSDIKVYNGNNEITGVSITPNLNNTFERICNNNGECTLGVNSSKDVAITVTNNTGSAIATNNFKVSLTFTPFYKVTYTDNVNGEIVGYVLTGGTYTYTFQNNPPTSVTVDSGTCSTPQLNQVT